MCFTLIMEEMLNLRTRIKRAFTSLRTLLVLFSMTYRRTYQCNRHSENLENLGEWNEYLIFLLFRICYNKYQGYTILANRFRIGVRNDYLVCLPKLLSFSGLPRKSYDCLAMTQNPSNIC